MLRPRRHRFAHITLICVLHRNTQIQPQTSLRIKGNGDEEKECHTEILGRKKYAADKIDIMGGVNQRLEMQ